MLKSVGTLWSLFFFFILFLLTSAPIWQMFLFTAYRGLILQVLPVTVQQDCDTSGWWEWKCLYQTWYDQKKFFTVSSGTCSGPMHWSEVWDFYRHVGGMALISMQLGLAEIQNPSIPWESYLVITNYFLIRKNACFAQKFCLTSVVPVLHKLSLPFESELYAPWVWVQRRIAGK